MPRPRVRPADRSRAAKACVQCQTSKKRCDAQLPCQQCVTKRRADSCRYPNSSAPSQSTTPSRIADEVGSSTAVTSSSRPSQHRPRDSTGKRRAVHRRMEETQEPLSPTMLRNSRGEQVYIGNLAALSFLHFLQQTLKQYIGSSPFTERQRSDVVMLEAELHNTDTDPFKDHLSVAEKQTLITYFLRASNGVLHLFTQQDISRLLSIASPAGPQFTSHPQHEGLVCLYLMIAIGAQTRNSDILDARLAKRYFLQAQKMAFIDMLQDPSLCMVKTFLLMAMYMLGACRRNTAFMYIGIASKAAVILGLHVPYQHVCASAEERASRRRVWMSLRVLDLLCSAILARPSSTPSIERDEYEVGDSNHDVMDHRTLSLCANYESSSIIEAIVQKFARASFIDTQSADKYLQMLREWSQALPEILRSAPSSHNSHAVPDGDHCETIIGNIHVSCTYYFGVIIVTRQFLISRIMLQLRSSKSGGAETHVELPQSTAEEQAKITSFSNACTKSAELMVQLCYEAYMSNVLLENMCILKAWLFSAGLVLGFSLLMEGGDLSNTHESFSHARTVLQKLARSSPQADQYHVILTNFSHAIARYREQLLVEKKETGNVYVEKIMSIGGFDRGNLGGGSRDVVPPQLPPQHDMLPATPSTYDCGDLSAGYPVDFFGFAQEMPDFTAQLGNDDGIGADLRWLCYAAQ